MVISEQLISSDVPIGCFLSGGLDSSLVTYYLSEMSTEKVKTFSIGFEDSSFDETNYANMISKYFDTDHHAETFSESKMFELLPKIYGIILFLDIFSKKL